MWGLFRMNADKAVRRVRNLNAVLRGHGGQLRSMCSDTSVGIGDVSIQIKPPMHPELVPCKFVPRDPPQTIMKHLRWIMQKDLLGQDVFLIGPPGPLRRSVAMMYLEMTKRECEYISLSRDTTETDLKQRREIRSGTAYYIDQCAVRAAVEGRVLILEGIEKAERNVLPVLNNLLENREMQLDDGRFLMAADRYDKLLEDHSKKELDAWKLVRVNERFRVIALGLPVPRYLGNPLDPPLRSRFQARDVNPLPFKEQVEELIEHGQDLSAERLNHVLGFANTMLTSEATTLGLPDFPLDSLPALVKIMNAMPTSSFHDLIHRLYPYSVMMGKEGQTAVTDTMKKFEITDARQDEKCYSVVDVTPGVDSADVALNCGGSRYKFQVPRGSKMHPRPSDKFVVTRFHDNLLAGMLQSHMVKDFCIIGSKGCGKSALVQHFADVLGYHAEPIMLYQDMTSRDLLQQRTTLPSGDTIWRPSPLIEAALEGQLAVLDGVHRINPGTFAVLHRLVHDRELSLFDGTRLVRHDRYEEIKQTTEMTDEELKERSIFPIHPAFRIIALAEPPSIGTSGKQWLGSELLTMFMFHHMRPLSVVEETGVIKKMVPGAPDMSQLLNFTHSLRSSGDSTLVSLSSSLSTRQLLRIAHRLAVFPEECLYEAVQKACLARFLPRLAKKSLDEALEKANIVKVNESHNVETMDKAISCEIKDGKLRIGTTEVPLYNPDNKTKVPDVLFYDNAQHLAVMEAMLKDFTLGEHLLLVGNQGVGKNKIVDRFLHLLNRPREYLQLHRDTTVQTLTLQPTVIDGVIVYEDSPLVRAVKNGHVLVVDEADKAPTHVTCILKTLVESGEMHLADGRRIVNATSGIEASNNIITIHPDFRMIVLANRPGFPFLGNDFFGAMGDIFSCHAVDNPNIDSEMAMLRQYGPNVPEPMLKRLVLAFGELRDMADQGLISYPYSTREVVNMVKHLEKFPNEGLSSVVRNVFDFDSYNKEVKDTIVTTLHKHGIPVGADPREVHLAKEFPLPSFKHTSTWKILGHSGRQVSALLPCSVDVKPLSIKGPANLRMESLPLDKTVARSVVFTEQEAFWRIPLHQLEVVSDVAVTKANTRHFKSPQEDVIHIAAANPLGLYSMTPSSQHINYIDLFDLFPGPGTRAKVKIAPLGASVYDTVVLHEENSNTLLTINTEDGAVARIETGSFLTRQTNKMSRAFMQDKDTYTMCKELAGTADGLIVLYKRNGEEIDVIRMLEGTALSIKTPIRISSMHLTSADEWLVVEADTQRKFLLKSTSVDDGPVTFNLHPIESQTEVETGLSGHIDLVGTVPLPQETLSQTLQKNITAPNRVIVTPETHATIAVGFPELSKCEMYTSARNLQQANKRSDSDYIHNLLSKPPVTSQSMMTLLPESGQVVRALDVYRVPETVWPDGGVPPNGLSGYLEITDLANQKLRYIPVPGAHNQSYYRSALVSLLMAPMSKDGLVTVDMGGSVRLWETVPMYLGSSLGEWRQMIGEGDTKHLQITYQRDSGLDVSGPKHGKVDPTGAPHVGGNTWAGGTGGRDTAGLGGKGGPYRLYGGGDVYQISDEEKEAVPEEVKRAAREMGQKAFKERLKEIEMSEYDADMYENFAKNVRKQVQSLRVILDSLQSKDKERQWLKNQTYGDLDESKLIEGLTGEKAIYKRRGEHEPEIGQPQQKPKRLKLVVDVSGSMYRFDGHDGRLDRELEAVLMVMEAFEGYEQKFQYDIVGHSGDGHGFEFAIHGRPPANNKERLDLLKTMIAHSQFCISGDHTLEATQQAIETITKDEADEYFVIVLSDANLRRYGIRPQEFSRILTADENVNTFAIFIGSLGDQAANLTKNLPSGRGFVCMSTKDLPTVLQQIFTSTMLSTR